MGPAQAVDRARRIAQRLQAAAFSSPGQDVVAPSTRDHGVGQGAPAAIAPNQGSRRVLTLRPPGPDHQVSWADEATGPPRSRSHQDEEIVHAPAHPPASDHQALDDGLGLRGDPVAGGFAVDQQPAAIGRMRDHRR